MCIIISISYVLFFVAGQCLNEIESFTVTKKGSAKTIQKFIMICRNNYLNTLQIVMQFKPSTLKNYMKFITQFL